MGIRLEGDGRGREEEEESSLRRASLAVFIADSFLWSLGLDVFVSGKSDTYLCTAGWSRRIIGMA